METAAPESATYRDSFVAQAMLGKLATWLRILGYDCEYERETMNEAKLVRLRNEGRILLTRDTRLLRRKALKDVRHFMVHHDAWRDQLRELHAAFPLNTERMDTRCVRCNLELESVEKETVRRVVPVFVEHSETRFARCPGCCRVYWPATHFAGMKEEVEGILH